MTNTINQQSIIMEKLEKDSLAFEMAKQLHEQYSANDNVKASNVISFVAAIAFVFVGFGYVYLQPYIKSEENDYQQILLMANVIADVILTLLAMLCVSFGYSTRRDHIVIGRIRRSEGIENWYRKGCDKKIWNYLPDYYFIMFVFSLLIQLLLTVGICQNKVVNECIYKITSIIILIISLVSILSCYIFYYYKYTKFQKNVE